MRILLLHPNYHSGGAEIAVSNVIAEFVTAAKAEQAVKWLRQFDPALTGDLKEAA